MPEMSNDHALKQQIESLENEVRLLRRNEAGLSVDRNRFQTIFNSMHEIYFEVDLKGNFINFNPALCDMLGYTQDELFGKNNREYATPSTARRMFKIFNNIFKTGEAAEILDYEILGKDDKVRYLELSAYLITDENGTPIGFRGLGRDISERKKTEESLKRGRMRYRELYKEALRAEELYQSLLNSSSDAILLLDAGLKVQFANPSFSKIFGWSLSEMDLNNSAYIPKPLKGPFTELLKEVLQMDQPMHGFETHRYTKDGRLIDVSISASRYMDHTGEAAGILLILRDISDAKKYQWHMEQAQKLESLGTLAGGVAHDFNNLLMGIQGRISLLMMNRGDTDPDYNHLKEIEDYINRASDLTRQMLGVARSGKYEVQPTDMNALVRTQNRMFGRTRKEISIHESFDADLLTAEVDQRQIDQVLLNIYVNASHAMPQGGDLYVRTSNEILDSGRTAPHHVEPGNYIRISITDTGEGMDKAILKRIFEPFFSTKQRGRGTGLGLASAYGIIKNHDGFITVYSEKGKGTTFNIFLPASHRAAEAEEIVNSDVLEGTGTILLVDDEEIILSVAEEMISVLGYNVMTAGCGQDAIELYRAKNDRIDMVILDMIMPGMGGGELFDLLKSINPHVKVLLSSGYSINGQASAILKRGCRGFIQKPFSLQELSQKISKTIASGGSA